MTRGGIPRILPPGSDAFDSIHVDKDATLVVMGPATLVVGDLYVEGTGEITFDMTGGSIEVYITGEVDLKADSLRTVTLTPGTDATFEVALYDPEETKVAYAISKNGTAVTLSMPNDATPGEWLVRVRSTTEGEAAHEVSLTP